MAAVMVEALAQPDDLSHATLKARHTLLQNKRLENRLAIERKYWIPKEVVRQVFTQFVTEAKQRCFNGIIRIVTLARVAPDSTAAAEEVRKEVQEVWRSLENSEWFKPSVEAHANPLGKKETTSN